MSLSMDDTAAVDYSDYEFQQLNFQLAYDASNAAGPGDIGNPAAAVIQNADVLGDQGGLSNDEVAELVYSNLVAYIEWDDEVGDQDVGTYAEGRGVFGTDLSTEQLIATNQDQDTDPTLVDNTGGVDEGLNTFFKDQASPEIFDFFAVTGAAPFDDETSGPGGAGGNPIFKSEKAWRNLTGRGPVLDATDDLSVAQKLIVGDTVIDAAVNCRLHLVWDVAELDDAGARFSIPG